MCFTADITTCSRHQPAEARPGQHGHLIIRYSFYFCICISLSAIQLIHGGFFLLTPRLYLLPTFLLDLRLLWKLFFDSKLPFLFRFWWTPHLHSIGKLLRFRFRTSILKSFLSLLILDCNKFLKSFGDKTFLNKFNTTWLNWPHSMQNVKAAFNNFNFWVESVDKRSTVLWNLEARIF